MKVKAEIIKTSQGLSLRRQRIYKYPFEKLEVGESFLLPYDEKVLKSIRTMSSRMNRKGPEKFRTFSSVALNRIEVARIE